jgi:predicted P-loop ATPase
LSATPVISLDEARIAEERRAAIARILPQLSKSDKGAPHASISNFILILSQDPALKGMVGMNDFTGSPVMHRAPPVPLDGMPAMPGPYPRLWNKADVSLVQSYLQRVWTHGAGRDDTEDAMLAVACMCRFHPVRDWLAKLQWDGKPRLDTWLIRCFGAADNSYTQAVSSKILIAAVRRVRSPGCKFDHMLILEGAQEIGKSTCIRKLATDEWFTDSLPAALDGKDAAIALQGVWIVEFAEIEQLIRAEVETIKAFLSRLVERYRPPYSRQMVERPRQFIPIGTTNSFDYLRDATGNRRFWPIRCRFADLAVLLEIREQLWAEAAAREAAGETHWLDDADVKAAALNVQAERMQEDIWTERIREYIESKSALHLSDLLRDGLHMPVERHTRREQMRVAAVLRADGWEVVVTRVEGKVVRRWERKS